MITPESSNEFPWISIWRLAKPHANHCVDILKACWLRPAFAESYRLLRVTLSKKLVARGWLRLCGAPGWNLERGVTVAHAENFHGGFIQWHVVVIFVCGVQGRIKGGQRGQLPRAPRWKGAPRDEIYLFQKNTRLKNSVIQKRYKNTTLYYIPMLR